MAWAIIGASLIGAGAGIFGSKQASDASKEGSQAALAEQGRQFNVGLNLVEPWRMAGYGALSDIAQLYGYALPGYQTAGQLLGGAASSPYGPLMRDSTLGAGGVINVGPHTSGGTDTAWSSGTELLGVGGMFGHGGGYNYAGGTINPMTGEVTVTDRSKDTQAYNDALTNYLRTGEWSLDDRRTKYLSTVKAQIDQLRESGWTWDAENSRPGGPGTTPEGLGPRPAGEPGDMSRFFTSPDYQFRLDQGNKAIERSAAARSGALNPNTMKSLADFSGSLASQEFGNYMNRLFNIAGMGQTATGSAVNTSQNYGVNAGNLLQAQGDARASGIMGATNSIINGVNSGMNNYLMLDYLKRTA